MISTTCSPSCAPTSGDPPPCCSTSPSTLFYVETAEQALLAALGPDFVRLADEMRRWGAINGSSTPDDLPPELADAWRGRDLSVADHRAAYAGLSRHAGLRPEQADALYDRGISPEAWTPFRETLPVLRRLHDDGVRIGMVSNIGWDPWPVLATHGRRSLPSIRLCCPTSTACRSRTPRSSGSPVPSSGSIPVTR